jgi:hypothetical protein
MPRLLTRALPRDAQEVHSSPVFWTTVRPSTKDLGEATSRHLPIPHTRGGSRCQHHSPPIERSHAAISSRRRISAHCSATRMGWMMRQLPRRAPSGWSEWALSNFAVWVIHGRESATENSRLDRPRQTPAPRSISPASHSPTVSGRACDETCAPDERRPRTPLDGRRS